MSDMWQWIADRAIDVAHLAQAKRLFWNSKVWQAARAMRDRPAAAGEVEARGK